MDKGIIKLNTIIPVLSAIQADDERNRAFAQSVGAQDVPWPVPYKDSVLARCAFCKGDAWVGPLIQQKREQRTSAGLSDEVFCLLCCYVLFGPDVSVLTLSDKRQGE